MTEPKPSVVRFVSAILRAEQERGGEGHAAQRVLLRLHEGLWKLIGRAGFDVLLARALVLAQKDHPVLVGVRAGPDGTLAGFDAAPRENDEFRAGATAIVSRFVELLVVLVGEDLAMRLLRDICPELRQEKE
jgi:hypothetical protein